MKVTVLVENTKLSEDLICEHGLSLLICSEGSRILLDAGSSEAFLHNAKQLNISLDELDACVLSHGHCDHAGGFPYLYQQEKKPVLYAMKAVMGEYYSASGGVSHYIGIPDEMREELRDSIRLIDEKTQIADGVWLIPHDNTPLTIRGESKILYEKTEEGIRPDRFRHELSLVYDLPKGLVIFNSCSHGGVSAIIREVQQEFTGKTVYAYFGGLHMKGKADGKEICAFSEAETEEMVECLNASGLQHLYTGHCTGEPAFILLKKHMGEKVERLYTGRTIILS